MANHQIAVTENGTKILLTAGKYCDRNIEVNTNVAPVGNPNASAYTGTITETVLGFNAYASLVKNDLLKEHRNDENLFVRVEFDIEPTPYTVVETWATNGMQGNPISNEDAQWILRWGSTGERSINRTISPLNTTSPTGVGCVQITEDGELRIYSNSANNYAIRPSNYTVIVEW